VMRGFEGAFGLQTETLDDVEQLRHTTAL